MTDHHVTLLAAAVTAGGPILAVMIGILLNSRQIDSLRRELEASFNGMRRELEARFDGVDRGLDGVEKRLDKLETRLEGSRLVMGD